MDSSTPGMPPKLPPKRENLSGTSSINGPELCNTSSSQSSVSNSALVRSLDDAVNSLNDSITELNQLSVTSKGAPSSLSSSLLEADSVGQDGSIMTTSLPAFPTEPEPGPTQSPRPTPRPRNSNKNKPPISKRGLNSSASSSCSQSSSVPTSTPVPTPRHIAKVASSSPHPEQTPAPPHSQGKFNRTEPPSQGLPEDENIYSNAEAVSMMDPSTEIMQGIPLPPADGGSREPTPVTPLSSEALQILDPTEYMSLWELQCQVPVLAAPGSGSQSVELPRTNETPPMPTPPSLPERKKSGPPIPPRESDKLNTFGQPLFPSQPDLPPTEESPQHEFIDLPNGMLPPQTIIDPTEFSNTYALSLPSDPFADLSGREIFNVSPRAGNAPQVDPQVASEPIYSLAADPNDQRLLMKRPTDPNFVSTSGADVYTQINKPESEETIASTYILADELDNHAVSYDSEDTVDEDSDYEGGLPDLPPKALPVVSSPRSPLTDRHGYLYKQGGKQNNKGWRKRYVTFDGARLRYFSGEKSRISKRIIPVQVMKRIESDVKDSHTGKFKFKVVTLNRIYLFAAETIDDHGYWTQILMQAIIKSHPGNTRGSIGQGMMPGGSAMHTPEKQGYMKLDDNKMYVAIKDGRLCYYKNELDFSFATGIHEVNLNIASIKDLGKNRLQFTTPYHTYSMAFESESESEGWKLAIEEGIATALSDDKVLAAVYQNQSNRLCADCSCPKPQWAVLHLVTMVCSSCAGVHRQFWPFKVKSLRMDVKIWTKPLINLYVNTGNRLMNSIWEGTHSNPSSKINWSATISKRQSYLVKKYLHKSFFLSTMNNLSDQPLTRQLNQELERSIKEGRLSHVVILVNKGADPSLSVSGLTSVQLAESSNHPDIAQYLKMNGAENETNKDIWAVIRSRHSDKSTENTVIKSGHLYKMGKKEYLRQWIVLTPLMFKIYDKETDEEPLLAIQLRGILNLSRHENEKNEPSFEFTCRGGNTYIYGADERSIIDAWIAKLHTVMLMDTGQHDLGQEFTKAGHAYCKRGHLGVWKLCWLLVKKRQLYILYVDGTSKEEVDLRKIHNMTIGTQEETSASPGNEKGPIISLFSSDRSLSGDDQRDVIYYIQSDVKQETERWFKVIDDASKESSPNLEDQQLNRDNVPVLIEKCIDFISIHGMKLEGIYRHAGTHSKITNLLNDLIKGARGVDIKMEEYTVNDVANVLKRYLRHLQEPIMSSALYGKWLSASNHEVREEKLYTYKDLLEELPGVNYATLKMIIGHLHRVASYEAENKMGRINLATVFGPVLLSGSLVEKPTQEKFQCTTFEIKLVDDLITYYQWLFSIDDAELQKETEVQKYIQLIKEAENQPPRAKDFIFSIYVNNNMGEPINMEVPATMTAEQVVAKVAQSKRIPRTDGYSLFHIICGGDLERSLAATEKVLDVNLASSNWSDEHGKGSYLCVKEDQLRDYTDHVSGPDICRYTELQFSDRKGWKKMFFELNESHLICYKDKSKTKHYEWELSLLSIYIGVEKKRKPPYVYGLTFLSPEDSASRQTFLGRSICFPSASEMYIWLSAMYSQSQDHLPPLDPSISGHSFSNDRKEGISKKRVGSFLKLPFKGSKS